MTLKAKKPEPIAKRLKLFLFGDYGVGKTTAAIQFPQSYVIDCEKGTDNYAKLFDKSKSVVLQSLDSEEIISELRVLASEKHNYKTVVIDPITKLEEDVIAVATKKFRADEKEGGDMRVWSERDRSLRRLTSLLLSLDMNVVVTAHGKVDYGAKMEKLGTTFDGWKRLPYMFDLVIELKKIGQERRGYVRKTRLEAFADGEDFPFTYEEIQKRCKMLDIERSAEPAPLASPEQVSKLNELINALGTNVETVNKWLAKESVEDFDEMKGVVIQQYIDAAQKKLKTLAAA